MYTQAVQEFLDNLIALLDNLMDRVGDTVVELFHGKRHAFQVLSLCDDMNQLRRYLAGFEVLKSETEVVKSRVVISELASHVQSG